MHECGARVVAIPSRGGLPQVPNVPDHVPVLDAGVQNPASGGPVGPREHSLEILMHHALHLQRGFGSRVGTATCRESAITGTKRAHPTFSTAVVFEASSLLCARMRYPLERRWVCRLPAAWLNAGFTGPAPPNCRLRNACTGAADALRRAELCIDALVRF